MQRSHLTLGLVALVAALWSTQCNSLSDDCKKTLTCGDDAGAPRLNPRDCKWEFPDGGEWKEGPRLVAGKWEWPNGEPAPASDCTPSGGSGGSGASDNCTDGVEANPRAGAVLCDPLYCDIASDNCVECLNDPHCSTRTDAGANAGTVCDPAIHRCVECRNDPDCTGTGKRFCQQATDPTQNECVSCLQDGDCGDSEVCDEPTGECTLRCTRTEDCRGDKPVCSIPQGQSEGVCVECVNDTTCSGGTPECNTATKECVPCVTDTPCGPLGRVCDPMANECVRCTEEAHCTEEAATPQCDIVAHSCVECLANDHCTNVAESRCNPGTHTCATCTANDQCEMGASKCRVGDGRCVECITNTDCLGADSRCETTSGTCVACTSNADCPLADAARCDLTPNSMTRFQCVGCTGPAECAGKGGNLCRTNDGLCVDCLDNAGCVLSGPTLSLCSGAGSCAVCTVDAHCDLFADRRACRGPINPGCVQCTDDNHCSGGLRCKTSTGGGSGAINTCVECLTNADCDDPTKSFCDADNTCQPCVENGECSHLTNLGVCDTSDGDGVCVQCTGLQRQACGANVCNSLTRQCTAFAVGVANICDPCVSDAHCSANGSERCTAQVFEGTDVGFFCFPASNLGACALTPFSGPTQVTSIDGIAAQLCLLRQTTCTAFGHFNARACTGNADCGIANQDDGRCLGTSCSIPCTSGIDCSGGQALDCLGGVCQF